MRLLHGLAKIDATFDDPHLVSRAGLVPVMALAQRAGLDSLVAGHIRLGRPGGVNAAVKVPCLVAGMIAGADSIEDMALLRHGAMPVLFGGIRAPSTLGSFLRSFTWGNVLQLGKVHRLVLAKLARRAPLLPGADVLAFVDGRFAAEAGLGARQAGRCVRACEDPGQEPAGAGPERAGGHGLHAAGRAGDRRHQAARRECCFVPRRRLDDRRGSRHRPGCRVHRHAGGADGLGVLRGPGLLGGRWSGSAFFCHRAHGSQGPRRHRRHRRRCLDADPLPPRRLG